MSDPIVPAGNTPAPAPVAAPAAPPPVAPLPVAPPAAPPAPIAAAPATPAVKSFDEAAVKAMIAEAESNREKAILKSLGVADPKDAKAAIEAWRKQEEANKTELQKAQERAKALEADAQALTGYKTKLETWVKTDLEKLTPEQRAAVTRLAGEDPLRVADAIEVLRPTWGAPAPVAAPAQALGNATAAPAAVAAPPPPMAPPATSGLPAATPKPGTPKSKWEEFDQMRMNNDPRANAFYTLHSHAIEASRPN